MADWLNYVRTATHFELLALVGLALTVGVAVGFCARGLLGR